MRPLLDAMTRAARWAATSSEARVGRAAADGDWFVDLPERTAAEADRSLYVAACRVRSMAVHGGITAALVAGVVDRLERHDPVTGAGVGAGWWWSPRIGTPIALGEAVAAARAAGNGAVWSLSIRAGKAMWRHLVADQRPGDMPDWAAVGRARAYAAALADQPQWLVKAADHVWGSLALDQSEGVRSDGGYRAHGCPHAGGYGLWHLQAVATAGPALAALGHPATLEQARTLRLWMRGNYDPRLHGDVMAVAGSMGRQQSARPPEVCAADYRRSRALLAPMLELDAPQPGTVWLGSEQRLVVNRAVAVEVSVHAGATNPPAEARPSENYTPHHLADGMTVVFGLPGTLDGGRDWWDGIDPAGLPGVSYPPGPLEQIVAPTSAAELRAGAYVLPRNTGGDVLWDEVDGTLEMVLWREPSPLHVVSARWAKTWAVLEHRVKVTTVPHDGAEVRTVACNHMVVDGVGHGVRVEGVDQWAAPGVPVVLDGAQSVMVVVAGRDAYGLWVPRDATLVATVERRRAPVDEKRDGSRPVSALWFRVDVTHARPFDVSILTD